MPKLAFNWTEARVDELIRMWRTGYTTYQMAAQFGVTRNTVCGKLHRVKIARGITEAKPRVRKTSRTETPRKPKEKKMLSLPTRAEFVMRVTTVPKPDEGHLASIIDVTGCRWPVSYDEKAPGGHLFCNHTTDDGQSYCPYHTRENVAHYSRKLIARTIRGAWKAYTKRVA